jgi:hypothetical protein
MTIKTPGKFEGEEDYAPYFYDVAMNGWGQDMQNEDGDTISVFVIDEEDADRYPQLKSRIGQSIAFRESDQGFWEEVQAPEIYEPSGEEEEPDLSTEAVITDNSRMHRSAYDLSIEGKHIGTYPDRDDAVEAFTVWSEEHNVYHNLFFVNERGAIDQLDPSTGRFLKGAPKLSGKQQGMRLQWLVPNNAYVFMFYDQLIRLHDEQMFFQTRAEALAAAKRRGLKVSKGNLVTTLDGAVPAVEGR